MEEEGEYWLDAWLAGKGRGMKGRQKMWEELGEEGLFRRWVD